MRLQQVTVASALAMNAGANIPSTGAYLGQMCLGSMQVVWTGTPTGTFNIQVSNDPVSLSLGADPAAAVVNWFDYTATQAAGGASGKYVWNVPDVGFLWVRLMYVRASGSGLYSAEWIGKGA